MKKLLLRFFASFVIAAFSLAATPLQATNNALHFDGSNDYVDLPDLPSSINFSQGFTFSAWVKWDAFQGNERIFELGNGNESVNNSVILRVDHINLGQLVLQSSSATVSQELRTANNVVTTGKWYHVAATINNANIATIYINGAAVKSGAVYTPANVLRVNNWLGKSAWASDKYFKGTMDEVSVWAKALTQTEIVSASGELDINASGLAVYYKFNQGNTAGNNSTETSLIDIKSGHNGTLKNFALTGSTSNWVVGSGVQSINLTTPGTLSTLLSAGQKAYITNHIVSGTIDARDIRCMNKEISSLTELDLSAANIVAYKGVEGTDKLTTDYPANEMPPFSFWDRDIEKAKLSLTKCTMPNSITAIGNSTFYLCVGLTGITIPNSVISIGENAFSGCSGCEGTLSIPNSVKSIGSSAFADCSGFNGTLTIPNSVREIKESAFRYCSGFTGSLSIPNSVKSIENKAFKGCSGFTGSLNIPNTLTTIGMEVFRDCSGFTGNLSIPNSVISTGWFAFYGCTGITSITIPNSFKTIGYATFGSCTGITGTLTLPNSITEIQKAAFEDCSGITGTLTIPDSVTTIDDYAFKGCSGLTGNLIIPNSVTTIFQSAFSGCTGLNSVFIPNSVTSIGDFAFSDCTSLTKISVANSTPPTSRTYTFRVIDKKTCTLGVPSGAIEAYRAADFWRDFTNIVQSVYYITVQVGTNGTVKENNITLGNNAVLNVEGGAIKTFTITPAANYQIASVTYNDLDVKSQLSGNSFTPPMVSTDATLSVTFSLTKLSIYVATAGTLCNLISDDKNTITNLTLTGNIDARDVKCMRDNMPALAVIDLSAANIVAYTGTEGTLASNTTYPANEMPQYSFFTNPPYKPKLTLTQCKMPNSITSIGTYAFRDCKNLTGHLTIPNLVTSIGAHAFNGCEGLSGTLTISSPVSSMGNYVFYNCKGFTKIVVGKSTPLPINYTIFDLINKTTCVLEVPKGATAAYKAADYWKDFLIIEESANLIVNITVKVGANGTVKENNVTLANNAVLPVDLGAIKTFTITPDANYKVATVKYKGTDVTSVLSGDIYKTPAATANATLDVTFSKIVYNITTGSPFFEGFESESKNVWSQQSEVGAGNWIMNNTATSDQRTPYAGIYNATLKNGNTDWLFTPIYLNANTQYDFEMYACQTINTPNWADITVMLGNVANSTSMTSTVLNKTGLTNGYYQKIYNSFTPTISGVYVLGIKGTVGDNMTMYISIDNIKISLNTVACASVANGSFSVDKPTAKPGEAVTISSHPAFSYALNNFNVRNHNNEIITVDANNSFIMPDGGQVIVSGEFKISEEEFNISCAVVANGSFSVDKTKAKLGETVTIKVKHDAGYILKTLTVKNSNNKIITVSSDSTFSMAFGFDVTVSGEFWMPYEITTINPFFEGFETGNLDLWSQQSEGGGVPMSTKIREGSQNLKQSVQPITGDYNIWNINTEETYNRKPYAGSYNAMLEWGNTDWLFTPLYLDANTKYEFEMYARQDGAVETNANITVMIGGMPNNLAMTSTVVAETGLTNGVYQRISGSFTPTKSGTYYLGIKGHISYPASYISIDNIKMRIKPITVSCATVANGSFSVDKPKADAGETVTITVNPAASYSLKAFKVRNSNDEIITVASDSTFIMPEGFDVTVSGEFWAPFEISKQNPFIEGFDDVNLGQWLQKGQTANSVWVRNAIWSDNRQPRSGSYNATLQFDNTNWLFTPLYLQANALYEFEMYARQDKSNPYDANITVMIGNAANSVAMTTTIAAEKGIKNGAYQRVNGSVTPTESGIYILGIKGYINDNSMYLSIDDIRMSTDATITDVNNPDKNKVFLYTIGRSIVIENAHSELKAQVYDLKGNCVANTLDRSIEVPITGLYLVRIGDETHKVMVK